jgi:hypothetical protein
MRRPPRKPDDSLLTIRMISYSYLQMVGPFALALSLSLKCLSDAASSSSTHRRSCPRSADSSLTCAIS